MLHALQWLIAYNMYYCNVSINYDALALLPHDGDLCGLTTMTIYSEEEESPAQQDADPYDALLASTFIPMPATGRTEQQTIRQSIQQQPHSSPAVS